MARYEWMELYIDSSISCTAYKGLILQDMLPNLVRLTEAHRRTTSFPQEYQEPNNSP